MPTVFEVQETVAVPEPVRAGGLTGPQLRPVGTVSVSVTMPANWLIPVMVIVELGEPPTMAGAGGAAAIVKSWTTNVTVAECERLALVPVILTWNVMGDVNVQDRVELPEPVMLGGNRLQKVLFVPRLTIPAKPLTVVIVMIEVPAALTFTSTLVGFAASVKSWTTNVTITEWDRLALVPIMLRWKVDAVLNVHDIVAVPEPVTLVGDTVQEVLLVVRLTMLAKP